MLSTTQKLLSALSGLALFATLLPATAETPKAQQTGSDAAAKPLKALLIAGGCCHDYAQQHKILTQGLQSRANIRVDVIWTPDKTANPPLPFYKNPDWAKGYDIVIHDECAALNTDEQMMTNIIDAHKTIPAVHLHCAMHSFRGHGGTPETFTAKKHELWRQQIGLLSTRHGPRLPVSVEIVDQEHPITKPLKSWITSNEELYNNVEVYDAEALAIGTQKYNQKGKEVTASAIVIWTNTKHGAPSFSTSLGHTNEVVASKEYLELVTRGTLWACGKLDNPAYMTPYTGSNSVKEIPAAPVKPKRKK